MLQPYSFPLSVAPCKISGGRASIAETPTAVAYDSCFETVNYRGAISPSEDPHLGWGAPASGHRGLTRPWRNYLEHLNSGGGNITVTSFRHGFEACCPEGEAR